MRRKLIRMAVAAAAVLGVGGLASSSPVDAGEGLPVYVDLHVVGPDAPTVLEGLTVELWDTELDTQIPGTPCNEPIGVGSNDLVDLAFVNCSAPGFGDYAIGVDGVPAGATVTAQCSVDILNERIPGTGAEFTLTEFGQYANCDVYVVQPALLVDKIVDGGDATTADFTIEVYDGEGTLVTTAVDPSSALCGEGLPLTNCAVVPLPAGSYQLGEIPAAGYTASNVWCNTFVPELPQPGEVFPEGIGTFTIGDNPQQDAYPFAECQVTNRFYEGSLIVTKTVVNDDGDGTATADDFTAEVYRDGEALEIDGTCDADGSCVSVTLPIGEYRIGESGPAGYDASVACTVTQEPDGPGPISTTPPTFVFQPTEAIAGDAALAEVQPYGEVTCVITNDDVPTTTAAPTTTIAPTTTDAGGLPVTPTLPETGSSSSNTVMIVLALGLLSVGGSLMALRRR